MKSAARVGGAAEPYTIEWYKAASFSAATLKQIPGAAEAHRVLALFAGVLLSFNYLTARLLEAERRPNF